MSDNSELLSGDHQFPPKSALPRDKVILEVNDRPRGLDDVNVYLVDSVEKAGHLMTWLGERREVMAVDTETTGLKEREPGAALRLVQIGDDRTGWAIPWAQWGGVFVEAMNKYEGELVFHNISFESRWLGEHSPITIPWHRSHDTMIMAHIIDPTQPVGLKGLADRFIDSRASIGQKLLDAAFDENKWDWATVPVDFDPYWQYGALDCVITSRLYSMLRADKRYPEVYDLEMQARRICSMMEDNGARVDIPYCEDQYDKLTRHVADTKRWWLDTYGIKFGSTAQLINFFESRGGVIDRHTKSGAKSLDGVMLKLLANHDPLAQNIIDTKKFDKIAGTYFKNFIEGNDDGFIHANIRTLGARTGRMSITKPALQTLHKDDPLVRNAIIPRQSNEVIIKADYDQIEMRLLAHFAKEEKLRAAFASDDDFFAIMAQQVFNDPSITKQHPFRNKVKGVGYGTIYGAGDQKLAETAGIPFSEMKPVSDAFKATYPGIKSMTREIERVAGERERNEGTGYVLTPYGRRLPAESGKHYKLTNYLLQSHAAEIFKRALINLDAAGLSDFMVLPVHDEVVFSIPRDMVEEASVTIRECMEITDGSYLVPLTVGVDGPFQRWGEKAK